MSRAPDTLASIHDPLPLTPNAQPLASLSAPGCITAIVLRRSNIINLFGSMRMFVGIMVSSWQSIVVRVLHIFLS